MLKSAIKMLGLIFLVLAGLVLCWRVVVQRQVADAKAFCESLVPVIQKQANAQFSTNGVDIVNTLGSYPKQADPQWWAGRPVPALIRTQDFYLSRDGTTFLLRIHDPSGFWDDVWGYDSRWMKWMNYDGY